LKYRDLKEEFGFIMELDNSDEEQDDQIEFIKKDSGIKSAAELIKE
jgi:hypothetical protein